MPPLSKARRRGGAQRGRLLAAVLGTAIVTVGSACGDIFSLKQENPGQLSTSTLYVPANAQLLTNGAISDFECAFSRYVVASGLLMDELISAIASSNNYDYERRTLPSNAPYGTGSCTSNQSPGVYTTLSTARTTTDTALARMEGWTDAEVAGRQRLIGRLAAYAGYSLVLLGEGMCAAAINVGPEMTPPQLFAEAVLRFDKAIAAGTAINNDTIVNFARLGRARALLDAGQVAAAGTEAALVSATFANGTPFAIVTSADAVNPRRQNLVFSHTGQNSYSSIGPSFRDVLLPNGQPDPRVATTNTTRPGTAPGVIVWTANKHGALGTNMPVAKYAEAQLIVAEARAAAGDLAGAQTAINNARNTRSGMPQYDATGQTQAQVRDQIIEERRRELFLEGHRLGDTRRYNLPLNPATGSAYTTGGGTYGDQRCFALPDVERINNPNIQ
jgi:starch-binding outer membrane protein, SusD/RagB family